MKSIITLAPGVPIKLFSVDSLTPFQGLHRFCSNDEIFIALKRDSLQKDLEILR
jgi:hypothetical protein